MLHRFKRATGEVHQSLVVPKLERTRKPKVVPSTSSFREVVLGPEDDRGLECEAIADETKQKRGRKSDGEKVLSGSLSTLSLT